MYIMCVSVSWHVLCVFYVLVCACECKYPRAPKEDVRFPGGELQAVVSGLMQVLGTEPVSSVRAV